MEKRNNYEISAHRARELFLNFEQQAIIDKFHLPCDNDFLYLDFIGETFRISRRTGEVCVPADNERPAVFTEVMSVFDFLCHDNAPLPEKSGRRAPVNSVENAPIAGGVDPFHLKKYARIFDGCSGQADRALKALGGKSTGKADLGYILPVFSAADQVFAEAEVQFYESDEEFDAKLTILWDTRILSLLRYETMYYVEGCICERIRKLAGLN